jgi:hypothetical protein
MIPAIERAVMLAMASCGTTMIATDGGLDATDEQGPTDATQGSDAVDGGGVTDASIEGPSYLPLPDGCIVTGKPDRFAPCGYTELINDPGLCQVDVNADGGVQEAGVCFVMCDPQEPDCTYFYYSGDPDGGGAQAYVSCGAGCIGRLHDTARAPTCASLRTGAAEYLARAAALEAASVEAFERVGEDLEHFGAPRDLIDAAKRAATEETEHARLVSDLARSFGGSPASPPPPTRAAHDRRAFAIENAVEGCVRETFGAALAAWQARHATDARTRETMARIATDEASHADLGWRIDAWLATTLGEEDRRAVALARTRAAQSLVASAEDVDAIPEIGLPGPDAVRALVRALDRTIWSLSSRL